MQKNDLKNDRLKKFAKNEQTNDLDSLYDLLVDNTSLK